jgi:hypothetical protein
MQCLISKRFKIPLRELRSVVLPAYDNVICTTNEGIKHGDYNRVLSTRKAQQLFKKIPDATRLHLDMIQLINAPDFNFPFIQSNSNEDCIMYLPGNKDSVVVNNFYVTLERTSNPNYFIVSYSILYSMLLQFFTVERAKQLIEVIKDGAYGIINVFSCCKILHFRPLTISKLK